MTAARSRQNPSADGPAAASPSAATGHDQIGDATLVALTNVSGAAAAGWGDRPATTPPARTIRCHGRREITKDWTPGSGRLKSLFATAA